MANEEHSVYVLGAGYSHAFCHTAPLLNWNMDDFVEKLRVKYTKFPAAKRILHMMQMETGRVVNIETILSRLFSQAPYDEAFFPMPERMALYRDIYQYFTDVISKILVNKNKKDLLARFSQYVIENQIDCITFNYDTMLDQSLWEYKGAVNILDDKYWHPDGGYGFFCRPAATLIADDKAAVKDATAMLLLKLHGSLNWKIKKGFRRPYPVDALVHDEEWLSSSPLTIENVTAHLEHEPFVIPPILDKSALANESILKVVWESAYNRLQRATNVVFIGYSFPKTDIAANFLFKEALLNLDKTKIQIVTVGATKEDKANKVSAYREVFHTIKESQFYFEGAEKWVEENCIWVKPGK